MSFVISDGRFRGLAKNLLLILAATLSCGQSPAQSNPMEIEAAEPVDVERIASQIDDPSSGARWLLVRNENHPGGPGRLVLAPTPDGRDRAAYHRLISLPAAPSTVIRAGDALVLEEHTAVVDTRLEAVALGPARPGARLRVRLKLGGSIVNAIASAPGHAILAPVAEARP